MVLESITNVSASEEYAFSLAANDYKTQDLWQTDQPVEITLNHQESILNFILIWKTYKWQQLQLPYLWQFP